MAFEDEVTTDAPELWWDTRQAVGASQPDRSGNGHTGTITGGPTLGADGLTFDGSGQWIESANIAPAAYASFCLEAVVEPEAVLAAYYGSIVNLFEPTLSGAMALHRDGAAVVYQGQAGDADDFLLVYNDPTDAPLVVAGLQHLLLDFDGTDLTLYLDGVVYGTNSATTFDVDFLEAAKFFLGDDVFGGDGYQGLIRHGIFYDHDLGAVRAAAHAAAIGDDPGSGDPPAAASEERPTLTLTADLNGSGADDLAPYGEEPAFSVQRGTTSPGLTGFVAEAGNGSTLLDNISRDLDPENASGPFFGMLRPKVGTVFTATWDGIDYPLLTGRNDDWPQSYPKQGVEQYVDFRATDLFQFLANTPINTTRPPELTHERAAAVLASINYPGPTLIEPGLSTVCGQDLQTVAALAHLSDVAQVEYGEFGINASGVLYFRGRPAIATDARSTAVQASYVQSGGLNFIDVTRASRPLVNHITITYGKDGRQVTVRDQDSIDDNDLQAMTVSLPFETASQARGYGRWLLLLYSTPRSDFTSVTFEPINTPGATPDLWAEVLSRKEGDLVQITLDPLDAPYELSGSPIVEMCWIRGVGYQFGQFPWRVTFTPQPSWAEGLFIMDASELDGPDIMML